MISRLIILILLLSSCSVNNILITPKDKEKIIDIPTYVDLAAKTEFSKDYNTPRIFEITYEDKLYQYLIKEGEIKFHRCIRLQTNYMPAIIGGFIGAVLVGMILRY